MPKKIVSLFKSNIFKLGMMIGLATAAILIVLAMMLGTNAGQFVIKVNDGKVDRSIALTTSIEDAQNCTGSPELSTIGMNSMVDYSPEYFLETGYSKLREITANATVNDDDTNYEGGSLYIYTFYIVNTSESGSVGVNISMNYSKVTNYLDEVIRIMTFTEAYGNEDPNIYQKADDYEKLGVTSIEYPAYIIQPTNFKSNSVVFDDQEISIASRDSEDDPYVKYSVLIWLEGNDPDTEYYAYTDENGYENNYIYGATIRFSMTISVSM